MEIFSLWIFVSFSFIIFSMLFEIISNFVVDSNVECNLGFNLSLTIHLSFVAFDVDYGKFWFVSLILSLCYLQ